MVVAWIALWLVIWLWFLVLVFGAGLFRAYRKSKMFLETIRNLNTTLTPFIIDDPVGSPEVSADAIISADCDPSTVTAKTFTEP